MWPLSFIYPSSMREHFGGQARAPRPAGPLDASETSHSYMAAGHHAKLTHPATPVQRLKRQWTVGGSGPPATTQKHTHYDRTPTGPPSRPGTTTSTTTARDDAVALVTLWWCGDAMLLWLAQHHACITSSDSCSGTVSPWPWLRWPGGGSASSGASQRATASRGCTTPSQRRATAATAAAAAAAAAANASSTPGF